MTYCFTNATSKETIERVYPMDKVPKSIRVGDKFYQRDLAAEWRGQKSNFGEWPILSDSVGVHPDQVKEAEAHAREHGVPTDFTPDGRAVLRNKGHRKRYCELIHHYDLNGSYGDPQQPDRPIEDC